MGCNPFLRNTADPDGTRTEQSIDMRSAAQHTRVPDIPAR